MPSKSGSATPAATPADALPFEQALAELEALVGAMEGTGVSLEQTVKAHARGAELIRICQAQLEEARIKLQIVEDGEPRPLDLS